MQLARNSIKLNFWRFAAIPSFRRVIVHASSRTSEMSVALAFVWHSCHRACGWHTRVNGILKEISTQASTKALSLFSYYWASLGIFASDLMGWCWFSLTYPCLWGKFMGGLCWTRRNSWHGMERWKCHILILKATWILHYAQHSPRSLLLPV